MKKILKHKKIRDFLVPHKGNNFKPHILHHKRLALHAIAAIAIKVIMVVFIFLFPVGAWLTPDLLAAEGNKVIALTNDLRASLNLKPLTENPLLDKAALAKASDMIDKQYFAHTGPDQKTINDWLTMANYKYVLAGDNLAVGYSTAADLVQAWKKSPSHYQNMVDPDFSEIGVGLAAGSYNNKLTTFATQLFATPNPGAPDELRENNEPVISSNPTPSLLDQYFFLKSKALSFAGNIFSLSSVYYEIILILAVLALLINIFVQIKKQHYQLIMSTVGLITLLILFIII